MVDSEKQTLTALRRRAEQLVAGRTGAPKPRVATLRRALHEIEVLQVELELQTEALARTRRELQEVREQLAHLYSFAPVGYISLDPTAAIVHEANDAAAALFGYKREELIGRSLSSFVSPESRDLFTLHLHEAKQGGRRAVCEVEFRVAARRMFVAHLESELAATTRTGSAYRLRTAVLDITRRVRAEQALRASERELLAISERERQRFGADLHDGLGQLLTATEYLGAALREQLAGRCPELEPQCDRICANLREAITQARAIASGLAPVRVERRGLADALAELARRTNRVRGVSCRFDCVGSVLIDSPDAASHLYRIAQEALNNALRHGQPTAVRIGLEIHGGEIRLLVEDNGAGFDPTGVVGAGMGLNLMRHRAALIGARLTIASEPGHGARVECRLPVAQ